MHDGSVEFSNRSLCLILGEDHAVSEEQPQGKQGKTSQNFNLEQNTENRRVLELSVCIVDKGLAQGPGRNTLKGHNWGKLNEGTDYKGGQS